MNWVEVLKTIGPAILSTMRAAQPYAPLIIAAIELAERTGRPGTDKKDIAKKAVELSAVALNTAASKEVVDATEAVKAADEVIDLVVDITNKVSDQR